MAPRLIARIIGDMSRRDIIRAAIFYMLFAAEGVLFGMAGPSLTTLQHNVGATVSDMDTVLTMLTAGALAGSVLVSLALDYLKRIEYTLIVSTVIMALGGVSIPFTRKLWQVKMAIFTQGFAAGAIDNAANIMCLHMWGKDQTHLYQALHFFYAAGGLIGPLILAPFLSDESNKPTMASTIGTASTPAPIVHRDINVKIITPYTIVFAAIMVIAAAYTIFTIKTGENVRRDKMQTVHGETDDTKTLEDSQSNPVEDENLLDKRKSIVAIVIASFGIFFCVSLENGFSGMIATYAELGTFDVSPEKASYLTSVYWAFYMTFRFVAIIASTRIHSSKLVTINAVVCVCAGLILVQLADGYYEALWCGTALVGLGIASTYPCTLAWLRTYVIFTFKAGAFQFILLTCAGMLTPYLLTEFVEIYPQALYFHVLFCSVCMSMIFAVLWILFPARIDTNRRPTNSNHLILNSETGEHINNFLNSVQDKDKGSY